MSPPRGGAARRVDVFLQPGEYVVGDAALRVRTMLGSCVSVTLWSPARRVGAMSHFLLASRGALVRLLMNQVTRAERSHQAQRALTLLERITAIAPAYSFA